MMSVAGELGIHHTLILRWMRRYQQAGQILVLRPVPMTTLKPVSVPHADQVAEIARLRREVERLRTERDILENLRGPVIRPVA